uniref:Uncharacterized protein n=2 Tax=Rhodosorus marinus TaxID=101924 RepID=A0A7S2ZK70_9RHOD|mmetsp:Transcript_2127/g.8351  ORF Transcript_2127/g.8351 Transcript_2127/m.8351 type:complete len:1040 (+) Transcript_2127:226-3345(+)
MEGEEVVLGFVSGVQVLRGRRQSFAVDPRRTNVARKGVVRASVAEDFGEENGVELDSYDVKGLMVEKIDADLGNGPEIIFSQLASNTQKAILGAAVAGAGLVGYAIVPSKNQVLHVGSGVVAAGAAVAGSSAFLTASKKGSKKVAAQILASLGPTNPSLRNALGNAKVEATADDAEWQLIMRDLYMNFFYQMVSSTKGKVFYKEINQLTALKQSLGLSGPEVGDAHFEVGRQFYRDNIMFLGDPDGGEAADTAQNKLNKLLFLSDRVFTDKEPEEAYMYETARLRKHFSLEEDEYNSRVSSISEPFYADCLLFGMNNDSVKQSDLRAVQKLLGVADSQARKLEKVQYSDYFAELIKETGEVAAEDAEELARLQELLNVSSQEAEDVLRRVAAPEFKANVTAAFDTVFESTDKIGEAAKTLTEEKDKLRVPEDLAADLIGTEAQSRVQPYIDSSVKFLRVSNVFASAKEVVKLLDAVGKISKFLIALNPGMNELDALSMYAKEDGGIREARQLYSIYLQELLKAEGKVTDEAKQYLERLKIILGLSSLDADEAYRKATGPLFKNQLTSIFKANTFDDAAREKLNGLQNDLTLPDAVAATMKLDAYGDRLASFVKDNRILTNEEGERLSAIRDFLGLDVDEVTEVHNRLCSPVYEQSVIEAMGSTGIIMDNVREALGKLKDRLMLSEETANEILYAVSKGRMKGYAMRALDSLERKRNVRGQTEQRDTGDDPFIKRAGAQLGIDAGGLNVELHNLVDFYNRNNLMAVSEVSYEEDGETKTKKVAEFPVTLRDVLKMDVLNELYKQYLIQCFSAKSREEKERLFASLDQLGSILGLEQEEVDKIHSDIGSVIYRNYISQQLLVGNLEEKDIEFLASIQKSLAMTPKQCADIMLEAKKSRVAVLLEQTISRQKIFPENARKVRTTAKDLDVDIVKDLGVPNVDRMRTFNVEIDNGIETGEITEDEQGLIRDAKEGWQLSDEDAKTVLLENIEKRTSGLLVQAASSVRQGNQDNAVAEVATLLKFGRLLPAEVILSYSGIAVCR